MRKTAKVFMNNRSQAVRLPKEFRFSTKEVFIRKEGDEVILSPRATEWGSGDEDDDSAALEAFELAV